jgi:hypothetical protein
LPIDLLDRSLKRAIAQFLESLSQAIPCRFSAAEIEGTLEKRHGLRRVIHHGIVKMTEGFVCLP